MELIANGQWFDQSCLHNETSIKTPKLRGSENFQIGEGTEALAGGTAREGMEGPQPFLHTLPYASLPFGCPWVVSFITNQSQ